MTKKAVCLLVLCFLLITACTSKESTEILDAESNHALDASPVIYKVETNFPQKEGWVVIPVNSKELKVKVEASNAETLLFWVAPTGTDTWSERELIGYDIDESNEWSVTWPIEGKSLHHHLVVQALGSDGRTITDATINITNE